MLTLLVTGSFSALLRIVCIILIIISLLCFNVFLNFLTMVSLCLSHSSVDVVWFPGSFLYLFLHLLIYPQSYFNKRLARPDGHPSTIPCRYTYIVSCLHFIRSGFIGFDHPLTAIDDRMTHNTQRMILHSLHKSDLSWKLSTCIH